MKPNPSPERAVHLSFNPAETLPVYLIILPCGVLGFRSEGEAGEVDLSGMWFSSHSGSSSVLPGRRAGVDGSAWCKVRRHSGMGFSRHSGERWKVVRRF